MLLLLWMAIGAGLRLAYLDVKPPWTDEFSTLVLSLGNSFESVLLDRIINIQDLLAPLIPNPMATIGDVIHQVTIEDRQPPIYFALAHLWMQLFPTDGGLANLWAARALPATIGILTIPLIYSCSYVIFQSTKIAHLTAAMFAVSPYGVYIAQEARHYSLAIGWTTISISCLAIACKQLWQQQKVPTLTIFAWIVANSLGMATHYLVGIALIAELCGLVVVYLCQVREIYTKQNSHRSYLTISIQMLAHPHWRRVSIAIWGTVAGIAAGWWLLASTAAPSAAHWLDNTPHKSIEIINPLFQLAGAAITMLSLLLVEVNDFPALSIFGDASLDFDLPIIVASAIVMAIFFAWVIPALDRGIKIYLKAVDTQWQTIAIGSFVAGSIGLYLVIPGLTGVDITRGARYQFVYFPGLMMLIGLGLAGCWQTVPTIAKWVSGKQAVTIVLLMGLVSSAIVASNFGYHKYYRPEQIVPMMQASAPTPILIATTHNSLVQVGEMMGLAWEMEQSDKMKQIVPTNFLLAHQFAKFCDRDCATTKILRETVERVPYPIDLWAINFHAPVSLPPTCNEDKKFTQGVYGYEYRLYHCQPIKDID